jgi:hypothetical protein
MASHVLSQDYQLLLYAAEIHLLNHDDQKSAYDLLSQLELFQMSLEKLPQMKSSDVEFKSLPDEILATMNIIQDNMKLHKLPDEAIESFRILWIYTVKQKSGMK